MRTQDRARGIKGKLMEVRKPPSLGVGTSPHTASSSPCKEHWAQVSAPCQEQVVSPFLILPQSHHLCPSPAPKVRHLGPQIHLRLTAVYFGHPRLCLRVPKIDSIASGMHLIHFSTCILRESPGCSHTCYPEAQTLCLVQY